MDEKNKLELSPAMPSLGDRNWDKETSEFEVAIRCKIADIVLVSHVDEEGALGHAIEMRDKLIEEIMKWRNSACSAEKLMEKTSKELAAAVEVNKNLMEIHQHSQQHFAVEMKEARTVIDEFKEFLKLLRKTHTSRTLHEFQTELAHAEEVLKTYETRI